jgi:GntR family transcriptional repressor for pyruvate dehydrogenase complex
VGTAVVSRPEKTSQGVARDIINEVVDRGLEPGTVLMAEAQMKELYDVSRGSLREALRILELLGFIHMKTGPGGGPVVAEFKTQQFSDIASLFYQRLGVTYVELLESRQLLEPLAARLAAQRRTDEDVQTLRRYVKENSEVDLNDDRRFRAVGQDFHDLIADMSGNKLLNLMVCSCVEVFATRATTYMYATDKREGVRVAHENIAKAVIAGNGKRAETLMSEHMTDYLEQAASRFEGIMSETVRW